jgi:hypothetical protein
MGGSPPEHLHGNPTPCREGAEAFHDACLAISPGAVETERLVTLMKRAADKFGDPERWREFVTALPRGRPASVEEVADCGTPHHPAPQLRCLRAAKIKRVVHKSRTWLTFEFKDKGYNLRVISHLSLRNVMSFRTPGAARWLVTFLARPRKVTKRRPPLVSRPAFAG